MTFWKVVFALFCVMLIILLPSTISVISFFVYYLYRCKHFMFVQDVSCMRAQLCFFRSQFPTCYYG